MARTNVPRPSLKTHEGGTAKHINAEQTLRRSIMANMLWESGFYESGESVVDRIVSLVTKVAPVRVAAMAVEARSKMKLRHVPLLLVRELAKIKNLHKTCGSLVADTLEEVIQRPDEICEYVALCQKDKKQPLSAQSKKGLAAAFKKFSEYALQKYNQKNVVKLWTVMRLVHPKPKDKEQEALWGRLKTDTLATPKTWETTLSDVNDKRSKKEKWEGLLKENSLGSLATIRNLRNFIQEGVDERLVITALKNMRIERVLPFRFIAAARYATQWEPYLEEAMFKCVADHEKLTGKTVLLIDVSGSMDHPLSAKSDMTRLEAACGLAILAREVCEDVEIFTFSNETVRVPARHGFALRDAIVGSQGHQGTYLGSAVNSIYTKEKVLCHTGWGRTQERNGFNLSPDRLIVITDEQSHDAVPDPKGKAYMINVASNQNGVGYGAWTHIDGWSEAVISYIQELEKLGNFED